MTLLLLDTHALVWAAMSPDRLGERGAQEISERGNSLLVSSVSAWELATKVRLGRIVEAEPIVHGFDAVVRRLGADDLPMTTDHALLAGALDWDHRDPFDRMLVAQAMQEGAVLVTRDRAIRDRPGLATLW